MESLASICQIAFFFCHLIKIISILTQFQMIGVINEEFMMINMKWTDDLLYVGGVLLHHSSVANSKIANS